MTTEVIALPDGKRVWRGVACGDVHALELFKKHTGIVGSLSEDAEHGVVLESDRIIYTVKH